MKPVERAAYAIGGGLMLSGLVHGAILLSSGGSWDGPVSLRKAATFGLSFGLTLINVTLIASFLKLADRTRTMLVGGFTAACVLETFLVSMQAWRGVPSHFNMQTRFDAVVAQALAFGGAALVLVIVALTVSAFRNPPALSPVYRTAFRWGLAALVGAQLTGGLMIATGVRQVIRGAPEVAFATGGWLKPVHGVLMHGVLVLPLLAWLISKLEWDDRAQARAMSAGVWVYVLVACVAVAMSFYG
jgi:hypothetical protein